LASPATTAQRTSNQLRRGISPSREGSEWVAEAPWRSTVDAQPLSVTSRLPTPEALRQPLELLCRSRHTAHTEAIDGRVYRGNRILLTPGLECVVGQARD